MNLRIRIDAFQIIGFVISAAIAIILLFLGQNTVNAVTLGLIVAALTQLLNLQRRLSRTEDRLLKANALSKILYQNEWLLNRIQSIVNDYIKAKESWFPVYDLRADAAITECYDVLHSLAEGNMIFGRQSPFSFGTIGITYAKETLKATTTTGDAFGIFWRSIHGEKYLKANANAVERGVKFTRIFIEFGSDTLMEDMDIIQRHVDVGIEVYVAFLDDLKKSLLESFLIMDDKLVSRTMLAHHGRVREWEISTNPIKVEEMKIRFEAIMRAAKPLDDVRNYLESQKSE